MANNNSDIMLVIDILKQTNRWLETEKELRLLGVDFFEAKGVCGGSLGIRPAGFPKANLSGLKLCNLALRDTDFSDTNMEHADLRNSDVSGCNFAGANLKGADLRNSNVAGCDFTDANLKNAKLTGVKGLDRANLTGIYCTNQPEIQAVFILRQKALIAEIRSIGDAERGGLCVCETLSAMHGSECWNKYPREGEESASES